MRIFHPLRRRPIALLWAGLSLSAIGDQLYAVALSWVAVDVLGPRAGFLGALQGLVLLLALLGIGRWADRWQHRVSMIGADLARAAILVLLVALWLACGSPSPAALVAAIVVLGVGQAVFRPALQADLPLLVAEPALLPAANGLLDATGRSARLLGPGLVAMLAPLMATVHFFSLDALSFAASAAAVAAIGPSHQKRPREKSPEHVVEAVARGVRAMRAHPLLGYVLVTTGVANGLWSAVFLLGLPLLIARYADAGGAGLGAYGLVLSAYGCTNLLATLVFGSRHLPPRPQFQMFAGSALVGAGIVLMGAAALLPPAWVLPGLAGAAAFGAAGGPMKDIPVAVLRQTRLKSADIAAAMRVYMAMNSLGLLIAMGIAPAVIEAVGIVPMVIGSGLVLTAIGLAGLVRHGAWHEPAVSAAPSLR